MKKPAILSLLISIVVLTSLVMGCNDNSQQSMFTPNAGSPNTYTVVTAKGQLHLKLVKEWSGTGNKKFYFDVNPGPFVIDSISSKTSSLGSSFEMMGGKVEVGDLYSLDYYANKVNQREYAVVNKSGHFIVIIQSSGCEWRVRVGTE